ncbi:FK506 binding protein 6 [Cricetulus griseus]
MGGSTRGPGGLEGDEVLGQVRAESGQWPGGGQPGGPVPEACASLSLQSPYERLSQRMLDISGDRGVLKDIIREGAGDTVTPDASVLVKYSGYLEHMDKPFDSNCFRKTPRLMKLGEDITLWGMELGLLSMRRGELARFLFKPTYAYGTLGCPPLIPPNATVLFEIELIDFLDSAESDKFCALTAEQQEQFPLEKVLKVAATEREFGNYLFRQNRFCDAKVRYKRALLLLHRRLAICKEQHLVEPAELLVLLNLSFVYLKLDRPAMALRYGEQALLIDQRNAKALFRCGQACLLLTEYEQARDFLVRAQKEQPCNHDINNELKKLSRPSYCFPSHYSPFILTLQYSPTVVLTSSCRPHMNGHLRLCKHCSSDGKAVEIPMCRGIGYNLTRMPNLLGHTSQGEAAAQLAEFAPLVQYGCHSHLRFFLCSLYAPMCTDQVSTPIPACRPMCEQARLRCAPIMEQFNFGWPDSLDCARLPTRNDPHALCMEAPENATAGPTEPHKGLGMLPVAPRPARPPGDSAPGPGSGGTCDNPEKFQYVEKSRSCAPRCGPGVEVFWSRRDKDFALVWMAVWSALCFFLSLIHI